MKRRGDHAAIVMANNIHERPFKERVTTWAGPNTWSAGKSDAEKATQRLRVARGARSCALALARSVDESLFSRHPRTSRLNINEIDDWPENISTAPYLKTRGSIKENRKIKGRVIT